MLKAEIEKSILYLDKKKSQDIYKSLRVQFPSSLKILGFNNIIRKSKYAIEINISSSENNTSGILTKDVNTNLDNMSKEDSTSHSAGDWDDILGLAEADVSGVLIDYDSPVGVANKNAVSIISEGMESLKKIGVEVDKHNKKRTNPPYRYCQ